MSAGDRLYVEGLQSKQRKQQLVCVYVVVVMCTRCARIVCYCVVLCVL